MSILDYFKKGKNRRRTVVIGLDGVPYGLLGDLMQKDVLPNLKDLMRQGGYLGPLEASIPEISSVSWSSFMTGTHPGNHGIFGFVDLRPHSYKMFFPNFFDLKVPTLFDDWGSQGKRSVVINLPATYPAREISGALISGFVAVDLKKAVYPASLLPPLEELGYTVDVDLHQARKDSDYLLKELDRTLQIRRRAADTLWDREDWDLFLLVITETDRLHHFLWPAYANPGHRYHGAFMDFYRKVDETVGHFVEKLGKSSLGEKGENHLVVLSDHGFTAIKAEVYVNRWLWENGFLSFEENPPRSLEDLSPQAMAFALDPSRIYIHTKGRYPKGSVTPEDLGPITKEISAGFREMTFEDGARVIKEVFEGKELYDGPWLAQGPDLVLLSFPGFDLKGKIYSDRLFGRTALQGMHTQNDAFFYSSRGEVARRISEVKGVLG